MTRKETYACPTCNGAVRYHAAVCPKCDADLGAIAQLNEMPDVLFNTALEAARKGQLLEAIENLLVAIHFRPDDAGAWRLLGKLCGKSDSEKSAQECFAMALRYESSSKDNDTCGMDMSFLKKLGNM